ncbi:hypothetical protein [Desulfosoma caldarium]|uniref:Uncharacterized protein n=1 Tax=Desulfosoma caldarium TaxID=610254 RepID=A0A3N1UQ68_9BACT|nr:hypothetical protein [Desulfosoma caldarium]ROQ93272.1 hypothetical protein EDC27_1283 [Desulfosoma caldarium]
MKKPRSRKVRLDLGEGGARRDLNSAILNHFIPFTGTVQARPKSQSHPERSFDSFKDRPKPPCPASPQPAEKRTQCSSGKSTCAGNALNKGSEALQREIAARFDAVDKRFEVVAKHCEAMDKHLTRLHWTMG